MEGEEWVFEVQHGIKIALDDWVYLTRMDTVVCRVRNEVMEIEWAFSGALEEKSEIENHPANRTYHQFQLIFVQTSSPPRLISFTMPLVISFLSLVLYSFCFFSNFFALNRPIPHQTSSLEIESIHQTALLQQNNQKARLSATNCTFFALWFLHNRSLCDFIYSYLPTLLPSASLSSTVPLSQFFNDHLVSSRGYISGVGTAFWYSVRPNLLFKKREKHPICSYSPVPCDRPITNLFTDTFLWIY